MARWGPVAALAGALACGGGGGGVAEQPACVPGSCAAQGAACGLVADGCGGTLDCGACPAGQACGGAGTPNACGPACEKTSCAAQGATCGTIPDGCGGELACGSCADGEACGAAGAPNACAPVPPTGAVGWVHPLSTPGPDYPMGAGSDGEGNRYLLSFTENEVGPRSTLRLEKLAPDGGRIWTREWVASGFYPWSRQFSLAVTPSGSVYLAASAQCFAEPCVRELEVGGGAITDSVLLKLRPDGELEWQRDLAGSDVLALATNDEETVLVARVGRATGTPALEKYRPDGTPAVALPVPAAAAALDRAGNVVAVDPGVVRKYSPAGTLVWSRGLPGGGPPVAVATAADGAIVVLSWREGDVLFGSSQIRSGRLVLHVVEADGRARFARGVAAYGSASLAVDPSGRAAVVGQGNCGTVEVDAFDLANADLWHRVLPDDARCWAGLSPGPSAYGADHRLFVTGAFGQPVELGGTSFAPRGLDALGVLLEP